MGASIEHRAVAADGAAGAVSQDLRTWLDAAAELARAVNSGMCQTDLFSLIAGTVVHLTGYDFASVLLPDAAEDHLLIRGSYGLSTDYMDRVNAERPPLIAPGNTGEGPSSRAYRSQRPVVLVDISADPTCLEWEAAAVKEGYRAILALPLIGSQGVLGVLSCYAAKPRAFSADEVVLMETFTNQAALAVEAIQHREAERAELAVLRHRIEEFEAEHRTMQRCDAVHRDLMRLMLGGENLERVTEHLARELRSDVLVEDPDGHPIGASISSAGLEKVPSTAFRLDPETVALLQRAGDEYRALEMSEEEGDPPSLVAPVVLDGELAGRIWVFNGDEPYGPLQRRILERGAGVIALAVSKLRTTQEVEWRLSREFLDDLLTSEAVTDPHATVARAKQLGVDLTAPHSLLVLRADPTREDSVMKLSGGEARLHRSLLTHVQQVVNGSRADALVAARGADVIVLWPVKDDLPDATELAENLRRHCRSYSKTSVSVGVGRSCVDVSEYTDAYRIAAGALDLTQRAGGRDRVVALGDLGVYRVLLQVKRPDELIDFMNSMLKPLYEYDGRRDTTLVETLRAFLRCGCNATTTAEAMIVHPNTVSYRLRRIEEILSVNCHDPNALLQFQFAFVIEDVLGSGTTGHQR